MVVVVLFFFLFSSDRLIGLPEGRARNHNRPQQVPALSGIHIQDVAVGAEHTLVLSSSGDVYAWGSNSEGQVAIDDVKSYKYFQKVICLFSEFV